MCVGVCADVDAGVGAGGTRSAGMGVDPATPHGQHSETPGNGCSVPDGEGLVLEKVEHVNIHVFICVFAKCFT